MQQNSGINFGKEREVPPAHVVIPLMGKFKGETGISHNLHAVVNETASKLKVRWWLERLNNELIMQVHRNCPARCDEEGNLAQDSQYQETFVHFMTEIKQERLDIVLEDVNDGDYYGIGR